MLLALLAVGVRAGEGDVDALLAEARLAEREGRYAEAVAACSEVLEIAPHGARAPTCGRRIGFLERRRDGDGGFAGWAALEQVRARFRQAPPEEVRALEQRVRDVAGDGDVAAVVRAEAAAWLARRALEVGDPAGAVAATEGVDADALTEDPAVARQLRELRAVALAELGRDAEAVAVEAPIRVVADGAPRPTPVEQVIAARRRRAGAVASGVAVGLFAVAALAAVVMRSGPRLPAPVGLLPLGLAVGGGGALAAGWDWEAAAAVPWMALGFGAVHLLALAALVRVAGPWQVLVRVLAALATVGVGWLALWWTGTHGWLGL